MYGNIISYIQVKVHYTNIHIKRSEPGNPIDARPNFSRRGLYVIIIGDPDTNEMYPSLGDRLLIVAGFAITVMLFVRVEFVTSVKFITLSLSVALNILFSQ